METAGLYYIMETENGSYWWSNPTLIKAIEVGETIEFIYKQTSNVQYGYLSPKERVFKVVYSCKDGKWNKSEPIYGEIIPATEEHYDFDELKNNE